MKQIVASVLHGLGLNAYQLAQLLSKLFPEVSRFIEDPNFNDEDSPGRYYAEAIKSHQKYTVTGIKEDGQESVKAYYKVHILMRQYLLLLLTGDVSNLEIRLCSSLILPNRIYQIRPVTIV